MRLRDSNEALGNLTNTSFSGNAFSSIVGYTHNSPSRLVKTHLNALKIPLFDAAVARIRSGRDLFVPDRFSGLITPVVAAAPILSF